VNAFPLAGLVRPAYAMFTQDPGRMQRYIDEALGSRDEWLVAATWMMAAGLAENNGDMDALRSASAEALHRFRVLGERWGLSGALRIAGGVRMVDGDLDGAAAAFAEASRVLDEMGSRDDQAHLQLRLAEIAARRGDLAAAGEFYQTAWAAAESGGSPGDVAIVAAGSALFEVMMGNVELARSRNATARHGLALLGPAHPAREHLASLAAVSGTMIALEDGDLPLAREHAARAYQAAIAAEDMPLLAAVAGGLAYLAHALGASERAAELLGACAPVRGGEDATELMVTKLGPRLRATLGAEAYARAYDRGKALSRAEAIALLDPARLASEPPA
jgi:tetratricopeptide (TPR) repeat protein